VIVMFGLGYLRGCLVVSDVVVQDPCSQDTTWWESPTWLETGCHFSGQARSDGVGYFGQCSHRIFWQCMIGLCGLMSRALMNRFIVGRI
jgi:hypothetical protein